METHTHTPATQGDAVPPTAPPPTTPPGITDTEEMPAAPSASIPKARFDAVNTRMKQAEADRARWQQLAEQRAADLAAAQAELAALAGRASEAETLTALVQDLLAARQAAIPEHLRALVGQLPAVEALRWLEAHADALRPHHTPAPPIDAGARGERGRPPLPVAPVIRRQRY